MERPSDQQVFINNVEFALRRLKRPVIIDEAQILPEIFPVLRALIDEKRNEYGQYYLLGSVYPALMKHISESLAGRVGRVELTPFFYPEISHQNIDLYTYWLKGDFPDALKEKVESRWQRWQENYVQKIIDRGYLINFTQRNYDVTETIRVISIENLLSLSVSGFDGVLLK